MKRFIFSLQKILELREFEEEQKKNELGQAVAAAGRIRFKLDETLQNRFNAAASREGCADINEMRAIENYIAGLDAMREDLAKKLAAAEKEVEKRRAVFAEAMKNRKVLSRLKDKQFEEYKKSVQRSEDLILDDIGGRRYSAVMRGQAAHAAPAVLR